MCITQWYKKKNYGVYVKTEMQKLMYIDPDSFDHVVIHNLIKYKYKDS